ncbi:MAG: prepilin-type N-terminal cleavage/methylation domain-containing protein [Fimbriimonadaceae bacterium]|nr:prepilin-type N-terminal cleavage/methylation domain-containing protein [Fimbriimonadaceae bacterium]
MRKSAFTLIELLVVIAIIAILAAILFPVFAQAKVAAKKTATLSQFKQIGTALHIYSSDYDDGYPTWSEYWYMYYVDFANRGSDTVDRYWDAKLWPYVKTGNPGQASGTGSPNNYGGLWQSLGNEHGPNRRSIGISMGFIYDTIRTSPNYYRYVNGSQVEASAETVFAGDSGRDGRLGRTYDQQGYYERWVCRGSTTPPASCSTSILYTRDAPWRFQDAAVYSFLDSHAKVMKGDIMFPRPPKDTNGNYPFPISGAPRAALECAHAQWFATTAEQRQYHRDYAANTLGYACN